MRGRRHGRDDHIFCKKAAFLLIFFRAWNKIKSWLEVTNLRLPPLYFIQICQKKEVQIEMGSICLRQNL